MIVLFPLLLSGFISVHLLHLGLSPVEEHVNFNGGGINWVSIELLDHDKVYLEDVGSEVEYSATVPYDLPKVET